ncbi:MAG: agmatine deiminase family protein [Verrucomicrobiota bacterium]|jgi:agmatine deiminase|nr:agmatine deiminase family protein [Verrucomicrobiota bacterium]
MPAEWEPHAGTWLTWPRREGISFPGIYNHIEPVFAAIIHVLSQAEGVFINVCDSRMEKTAREILKQHDALNENVDFFHHPSDEPWCRDHGPIFVRNESTRAVIDWDYNAWGNKYSPYENDNQIPTRIASARGLERLTPGMVLEGGSIEVNGQGTLLTTESCLLNPNRNPNLTKEDIEQRLREYLGVTNILWLGNGIAGDDTDGHIDDLTRFVNEHTVVTAVEKDESDKNHQPLLDNLQRLQNMQTQDGQPLNIVEIPMPGPVVFQGERLPASYVNFYVGNEVVLMPSFRHENDPRAKAILQGCFPTREVIDIDSTNLAWGLGSFHCLTQQEPD